MFNPDEIVQAEMFENLSESYEVFLKTKLFPVRVHRPWYKRYANLLPKEERTRFQPFEEVRNRETEIAFKYFYGDSEGTPSYCGESFVESRRTSARRRLKILQGNPLKPSGKDRDSTKKRDENAKMLAGYLHTTRREDVAVRARNNVMKTLEFMSNRSVLRRVAGGGAGSVAFGAESEPGMTTKWDLLKKKMVKLKLHEMYEADRSLRLRRKFQRTIRIISAILRWLRNVSMLSDCHAIITKIYDVNSSEDQSSGTINSDKAIFDSSKHKHDKTFALPTKVFMTMTQHFGLRSQEDVTMATKCLRTFRNFSTLPLHVQQKIASCAWIMSIPANKMIIRQNHEAMNYYIMLCGRAIKTRVIGNPYFKERSCFKILETIKRDTVFGTEVLLNPGCLRKYSVKTTEKSILLSVNIVDFQASLLKDAETTEPDHLSIIRKQAFMRKISPQKILDEAPDSIFMFYFVPGTVITKSVRNSEFVYVIKNGTCRALIEILPPLEDIVKYNKSKEKETGKTKGGEENPLLAATEEWSCDEIQKDQPKRSIIEMTVDVKKASVKKWDTVEKASVKKWDTVRQHFDILRRGAIDDRFEMKEQMADILLRKHHIRAKPKEKRENTQLPSINRLDVINSSTTLTSGSDENNNNNLKILERAPQTNKQRSHSDKISRLCKRNTKATEKLTAAIDVLSRRSSTSDSTSSSLHSGKQPTLISRSSTSDSTSSSRYTWKQPTLISRKKTEAPKEEHGASTMVKEETKENIEKEPMETSLSSKRSGARYSKWKLHRKLIRGDLIGDEWTNARNVVKPIHVEKDSTLVSDGSEVIMVRKELMYRRGISTFD